MLKIRGVGVWQARGMRDDVDDSAADRGGDSQPPEMPQARLDPRKSIALGALGLGVIVLIFWQVIPQIGSYSDAVEALQSMSWIAVVIIAVTVVVYLAMYGLIFMAAEPRLRYWQSQQVKQASFTISNGVPAGGAVGLAVQFGMLASYKIPATSATAAITAVSLWSTFASLGFPILGVLALTIVGAADGVAWMGPVGLGILILIIAVFVSIMRSQALAERLGAWGNAAAVRPLARRIRRLKDLDVAAPIVKFRREMYDLLAEGDGCGSRSLNSGSPAVNS